MIAKQLVAIGVSTREKDADGKISHTLEIVTSGISPFKTYSNKGAITLQSIALYAGSLGPFTVSHLSSLFDALQTYLIHFQARYKLRHRHLRR